MSIMRIYALISIAFVFLLFADAFAYFKAVKLTTVVYLNNSTNARVVENIELYLPNNATIENYMADRNALNQSIGSWGVVINSSFLMEHIYNPNGGISNFSLLAGPAITNGDKGYANITMIYIAKNITTIRQIAPRKFEYTFNDACLNFEHTSAGPELYKNATLEIVLPKGASLILPVYPSPDAPIDYKNATTLYWFESETLGNFRLTYTITESLQQEVLTFFTHLYPEHAIVVYLFVLLVLIGIALFALRKLSK